MNGYAQIEKVGQVGCHYVYYRSENRYWIIIIIIIIIIILHILIIMTVIHLQFSIHGDGRIIHARNEKRRKENDDLHALIPESVCNPTEHTNNQKDSKDFPE